MYVTLTLITNCCDNSCYFTSKSNNLFSCCITSIIVKDKCKYPLYLGLIQSFKS